MTDDDAMARQAQGLSFGPAAQLYDAVRPTYPPQAVAWALQPLGPGRWHVADIGAGTGIMTRVLADAGQDVVAVEPDPQMRAQLLASTPQARAVAGSAESISLPDESLDAAIAAQSYHWFDHEQAHAELARTLRPGGVFAAVWNDRDATVGWVAAYTRIVDGDGDRMGSGPHTPPESFGPGFGPVEHTSFRHRTRQTPQGLVALLSSRSYYLVATLERRQELVDAVLALTRTHPELVGRDEFDLPYVTSVYRAVRLPA
jgi:SAM-dependent methyltransferase